MPGAARRRGAGLVARPPLAGGDPAPRNACRRGRGAWSRSSSQQAVLARGVDRLRARGRVELAEEVARVGLGRRLADAKAPGDLLEAQPLLQALEQLALARGERHRGPA